MHELLENFGVEWKLLAAQVVNFFILFLILKKFAYKPVVGMLREREARIKRGLEAASESERTLSEAKEREAAIMSEAEKKALGMVTHAETIAYEKEAMIVDGAHKKAEAVMRTAEKAIEEERAKQIDDIHKEAQSLVALATAKVLGKKEPASRDEELVREALDELRRLAQKGI